MKQMKKILVKPNIKNVFLKNGRSEKVTYLDIPSDFYNYSLSEDMKNGGKHYKELKELMEKSQTTLIS